MIRSAIRNKAKRAQAPSTSSESSVESTAPPPAKKAKREAEKAVDAHSKAAKSGKVVAERKQVPADSPQASETMSQKADIIFPALQAYRSLQEGKFAEKIHKSEIQSKVDHWFLMSVSTLLEAGVYMAATLQYVTTEVLELAGYSAHNFLNKDIKPRHIKFAIGKDEELRQLLSDVIIPSSGVLAALDL